jgi:hypothetical protein
MALLNALKTGTYSTVRVFQYNKQDGKELRFAVDIWENSSKKKLLATIEKSISNPRVDKVIDAFMNDAPSNPSYGDRVVVGNSPTGHFSEYLPGMDLEWVQDGGNDMDDNPTDAWVNVSILTDNQVIHVTSENKYYVYKNDSMHELKSYVGPNEWDRWFDSNQWNQSKKNLLSGIYEYLKTTPEFKHCSRA